MTTVYFAGSEDVSFLTQAGSFTTSSTGLRGSSSYCRLGVCVQPTLTTTTMPPTSYGLSPVFTSVSSFWTHCVWGMNIASVTTTSNTPAMWWNDSGGVARIVIRHTGTAGQWKVSKRDAAGSYTDLVTSAAAAWPSGTTPNVVDIFINYAVAGQVIVYFNGVSVMDTGAGVDVTTNSATTLAQLGLQGFTTNSSANATFSEIIVQDTSTIGCALISLVPQAAGNTQSWTPNTIGNINEIFTSDVSLISTASNNDLSEWTTIAASAFPGGTATWTLEAVVIEARIARGGSGPQHFDWVIRTTNAVDNLAGTSEAPSTVLGNLSHVFNTNPNTAGAWAIGDIASGFNIGIKSLA